MFPDIFQFHVAPYIDDLVQWLLLTCGPAFDAFTNLVMGWLISIEYGLVAIPWWAWMGLVGAIAWRQTRRWQFSLGLSAMVVTIGVLGLWEVTMETLSIVIVAVLFSLIIGIPLGILMAESDRCSTANPAAGCHADHAQLCLPDSGLMLLAWVKYRSGGYIVYASLSSSAPTWVCVRSQNHYRRPPEFRADRWQMLKEVRLPLAAFGFGWLTDYHDGPVHGSGSQHDWSWRLWEKVLIATNRIAVGDGFETGWAIVVMVVDHLTRDWPVAGRYC